MQLDMLDEHLYAEDMASRVKIQVGMGRVLQAYDKYNFTIITKKTSVVHQQSLGKIQMKIL